MSDSIKAALEKIEQQLKPFQAASVQYVLDQFYERGNHKVLIADEVGMGKTIIAKGVIAKSVERNQRRKKPFHVVYICSNQVLAQQNIKKLNPFSGKQPRPLKRLIFLALKPNAIENEVLQLSSLTPGTSFKLTQSVGYKDERAIIFFLLMKYKNFERRAKTFQQLMKGNRRIKEASWKKFIKGYLKKSNRQLRPRLALEFKKRLKTVPFSKDRFKRCSTYLGNRHYESLSVGLNALLRKLDTDPNADPLYFSYEIVRALRQELTQVCVAYLDADLFILDEFQRFKTLLDGEDQSEAGEIAKAVLQNNEAKALLLSATPFKPFTTQLEQLNGESHHEEFRKLVEFLGGENGANLWKKFQKDQEAFFKLLRHPKEAIRDLPAARRKKRKLEKTFKSFLSRNERMSIAKQHDNMVYDSPGGKISIIKEDIKNFIALDRLVAALAKITPHGARRFGSTLEFSKSAPYPLSYLQGYKLRALLEDHKADPQIKSFFKKNDAAWLSYKRINNYQAIGFYKNEPTYPNGKLRVLARECFKHQAEFLLWVPPSKPYYQAFGAYEKAENFSKILIFSGWVMVPRAISTLLSYEVERRTIGTEKLKETKEQEPRTYFSKSRKPSPLLTYDVSSKDGKASYKMTNFVLTYPAMELMKCCVFEKQDFEFDLPYRQLRELQQERIVNLFKEKEIEKRYVKKTGSDARWYWVAAPLLDHAQPHFAALIDYLTECASGKGMKDHWRYFKTSLEAIVAGEMELGEFPKDLMSVLADSVMAAPANATVCALKKNFRNHENDINLYVQSFFIAEAFCHHFNKPESISAIRMKAKGEVYWRKVLNYCAAGNITSMLEEYFYLLKDCEGEDNICHYIELMENVLKVKSSSIQVDFQGRGARIRSKQMRCHFAISYGDQKLNTETGDNRMTNVRTVFNSPFRPFVLTSTSIGQEGLDFHYYCRKIFHWNLPHNAIDLEQREGRINRYKGLVIRHKVAKLISNEAIRNSQEGGALWEILFKLMEQTNSDDHSGIKPFWYIDEGELKIERFVPIHELSKDTNKYEGLKTTLALYRLTFGQPRQEELIQALKSAQLTAEELTALRDSLLINLSPLEGY